MADIPAVVQETHADAGDASAEVAGAGAEVPDAGHRPRPDGRRYSPGPTRLILALMLLYTAYLAAAVLIPITLAVILSLTLSPLVDQLNRWYVPRALAAALIVVLSMSLIGGLVFALAEPATEWMNKAPSSFQQIERKLRPLRAPVDKLQEVEDKLNALADAAPSDGQAPSTRRFELVQTLFTGTPDTLFGIGATIILLFFLLSQREPLLRNIATTLPHYSDKKLAVSVVRDMQEEISKYLSTITVINLTLGLVTAGMLALLGFPNPALWGVMAGISNFVPYLGALFNILVLTLVSLLSFEDPATIMLAPLLFAALTTLEGQVITPLIVGNRLALNPVIVFVLILVLGWMWGVAGVLIAIPVLTIVKIVSQAIEPLHPIARLVAD